MQFGVLGPLRLVTDGRVVPIASARRRAVLAVLVSSANQTVSIPRLIDSVWGERPAGSAQNLVHTYVWRLRTLLGGARLATEPTGYRLRIEAGELDAARFEALAGSGHRALAAGRASQAADDLSAALELWRGEPFADVTLHDGEHAARIQRLSEARVTAWEDRIEADLLLGRHSHLISELRQLTLQHPLRERAAGQLMLACYRAGRPGDALAAYDTIRTALAVELGADPGRQLRELHVRILRCDPGLTQRGAARSTARTERIVPRQLPHTSNRIAGRTQELKALSGLLDRLDRSSGSAVCVIDGTAGVGKSALAMYWGRLNLGCFPDGQLYVNLRGFAPEARPVTPAAAVRGFLDALAVPADRVPQGVDAQAALYRSLVADRRMLVVLDNARDTDQVRPLLPGGSACLTLVTSRAPLTGLIATDNARPLTLGLLAASEARELLDQRLGRARTSAQPVAVDALIELCARLPLALAIAAARATAEPALPLASLVEQLRDARDRLTALDLGDGDGATDLRAVFSWSYQTLGAEAARVFRLLSLHPGPEITAEAAADLVGTPIGQIRTALHALARANLIAQHVPGRYNQHDLLRAYAAELAHEHETDAQRTAATQRMLDHYVRAASAASVLIDPAREHVTREQAVAWFTAEHSVLMALLRQAESAGFDTYTVQLASAVAGFFERYGHWHDQAVAHQAALTAASRLGDRPMQAYAHRILGFTHFRSHRFAQAIDHYRQSLTLLDESDDADASDQAHAHYYIAFALQQQGDCAQALSHAERALDLYRAAGHSREVQVLGLTGVCYAKLGEYARALAYAARTLALSEGTGDPLGFAMAWWCLGLAHHGLGDYQQAITWYRRLAELHREHGDRHYLAETLLLLGDAHRDAGEPKYARDVWRDALGILDDFGHPGAESLRARVRELESVLGAVEAA